MDQPNKTFAPELSPAGSRRWIGRLIIAVVVGVAIWNFVVSLTVNLVLPALARVTEADPRSPFYLGNGEINLAPLLTIILELCFALIAAILVHSWSQRSPRPVRKKSVSIAPTLVPSLSAPGPSQSAQAVNRAPVPAPVPTAPPAAPHADRLEPMPAASQSPNPPQTAAAHAQPSAPPAKTEKPAKPKKVYYNIVGERIEEDDE